MGGRLKELFGHFWFEFVKPTEIVQVGDEHKAQAVEPGAVLADARHVHVNVKNGEVNDR